MVACWLADSWALLEPSLVCANALAPLLAGVPLLAQAAAGEAPSFLVQMFPIFLIFGLFYFLMMRPAQKEREARESLLSTLKKNDRVVTGSGIVGVVIAIRTDVGTVTIRSAEDTKIEVVRSSIARILNDEPAEKPETNP